MTVDFAQLFFGLVGQSAVAAVAGAGVAVGVFKFLGKSWIQNYLSKDLEAAKSELSVLASRQMRLHDREYIVFPKIWSKLNNSATSIRRSIGSFRQMPDFNNMKKEDLVNWVLHSDFSDGEKSYFSREQNKNVAYGKIMDWREFVTAHAEFWQFHEYLMKNRIFISPDIKEKLDQIDLHLKKAWIARKMDLDGHSRDSGQNFLLEAHETYNKQVQPLMEQIEVLVQAKLFPEDRAGAPK